MEEVWKDIEGYENYQVSNYGRVRSLDRWVIDKGSVRFIKGIIKKPNTINGGYLQVPLWKNGKGKSYLVHRLVAEAFLDNPDNYKEINHKNEVKTDNRAENLEYCDRKYNVNYGTRNKVALEKLRNGKLSKKVYQYSLDGEFLAEYPSAHEVERQLGFAFQNISKCCLGKRKTAYGYVWKYD